MLLMAIAALVAFSIAPTTAIIEVPPEDLLAGLLLPEDWVDVIETNADHRTILKSVQVIDIAKTDNRTALVTIRCSQIQKLKIRWIAEPRVALVGDPDL